MGRSRALAVVLVTACLVANLGGGHGSAQAQPMAGWFGVFPILANYQRTFQFPVVAGPHVYRQRVGYRWMGDADRLWDLSLSRSASAVRHYRAAHPTETLRVKGRVAYLWNLESQAAGHRARVRWRLVIILSRDKLVLLEARGFGPFEPAIELARKFDLQVMTVALDKPPRTSFARTLQTFRALRKGVSYAAVTDWVGWADADIGSGIHVLVYALPDHSRILLGFPDLDHLLYADHVRADGTVEHLIARDP